jgi:hypothetical protein
MEFSKTRLAGIVALTTVAYALYRVRSTGAEPDSETESNSIETDVEAVTASS